MRVILSQIMQWNQGNIEILFTNAVKGLKTEEEVKIWNSRTQERR